MAHANDPAGDAGRPTSIRYLILTLLALGMVGAYLTRGMAAVNTTVGKEVGYTDAEMGAIISGFAIGYLSFQVPGGWLGSRFGPRTVLPVMALLWSGGTLWTTLAVTGPGLYWSRVAVGLAQGGLIPCTAKVLSDWFPLGQRGIAGAVMAASMQVGGILNNGLTAGLLGLEISWRDIYQGYALVGAGWALLFWWQFRNHPGEHPRVNQAERDLIRGPLALDPTPAQDAGSPTGGRLWVEVVAIALSVNLWAICLQGFCRAFGYGFFTSWFPAYLEKARSLQTVQAGLLNMAPVLAFGLGSLTGGVIVDHLLHRTGNKRLSRSGTAAVALTLAALCTLSAAWVTTPLAAVAVISLGSYLAALAGPPNWAALMDMSGKHAAVIMGVMNMVGNAGDATCAWGLGRLFSYIQETSADWNLVLYLFGGVYLLGAGFWLLVDPNRIIGSPARPSLAATPGGKIGEVTDPFRDRRG